MFAFAICDLRSGPRQRYFWRGIIWRKAFLLFSRRETVWHLLRRSRRCCRCLESNAEIDPESLHQYLTFLWVPDPKTMFRGIYKLPAGHYAIFRDGELKIHNIGILTFPLAACYLSRVRSAIWRKKFASDFAARWKRRWSATFPIGAFLSAGLGFLEHRGHDVACDPAAGCAPTRLLFPTNIASGENTLDDPEVASTAGATSGMRESSHCS